MNMKSLSLFSLLCVVSLAVAQSEECFPGLSLEELKAMRDGYRKTIEETPQGKKKKIAKEKYDAAQLKLADAKMLCGLHKGKGWAAWAMSATEKDCDSVEVYEREWIRSGALLAYANEQIVIAHPELKTLHDCILKREYEALEITEETA